MICPNCKSEVANDSRFCPNCGQPIVTGTENVDTKIVQEETANTPVTEEPETPDVSSATPQASKTFKIWPILGLGLVVLAFCLCKVTALGIILAIAGLVFSIIGCKKRYKLNFLGIIGIPLSVIALIVVIIVGAVNSTTSTPSTPERKEPVTEISTEATVEDETITEAETSENITEASTEKVEEITEVETPAIKSGDIFHVGDTFMADKLKIVYEASGEFYSDNMFIQPDEGNKFIFLKLFVENTGNSDKNISYFDFSCYADGYTADTLYTGDNLLSATLSSGRTAEGFLYFEVPANASEIEIEYDYEIFGNKKITLLYEGILDSGFVAEASVEASKDAHMPGESVKCTGITITYKECGEYHSDNMFIQPDEGYRYLYFDLEVENTSKSDQIISLFEFECYADGASCSQEYLAEGGLSTESLSSGKKTAGLIVFEVPYGATTVEVEFDDNIFTNKKIVFSYVE